MKIDSILKIMRAFRSALMIGIVCTVTFAASVKENNTPLRSGCAPDAAFISNLPAGLPIVVKFALAGESVPCYKVGVEVNSKHFDGYLPASAIEGLEDLDRNRKNAAWVEAKPTAIERSPTPSSTAELKSEILQIGTEIRFRATPAALHAKDLIDHGRVQDGLDIIDKEALKEKDSGLLVMAAVAAMRSDQNKRALEYFRQSLDLEQNSAVEKVYKELLREANADQSITKLYGINVVLRFDSNAIPVDTAREMLGVVDETLLHVSQQLGCQIDEKIITIGQTWQAYKHARGAVEWSAGMFDGRIRVPMEKDKPMGAESRKTLAHEATHACLSSFGHLPQWLHEGLAQKLSGESLSPHAQKKMAELAKSSKLAPLEDLGGGWSRLSSEQASYAYAEALLAVDFLFKDFGNDGVRNLLRNPERIPSISAELDKRLAQ